MEDVLRYIVEAIVEHPEAIEIQKTEVDTSVTYTITADPEDTGKIIGKGGRTIQAIRNILRILAIKQGKWVTIQIGDQPQA